MGKSETGSPTRLSSWTIFFLLYFNLPVIINDISTPTIFADDTNIIITHSKLALERLLLMGSSLDEYFDWISRSDLGTFT
jgi:hypothetical protein